MSLPHSSAERKRSSPLEVNLIRRLRQVAVCINDLAMDNHGVPAVLSSKLANSLAMVVALAWTGEAAQNAEHQYGVPASFMVAHFITDHGYCAEAPPRYFVDLAQRLISREYRLALEFADSPVRYTERLMELGFFGDDFPGDIASNIAEYDLFQIDQRYRDRMVPHEVSISEAAQMLGRPKSFISNLICSGELSEYQGKISCLCLQSYQERKLCAELWRKRREPCARKSRCA